MGAGWFRCTPSRSSGHLPPSTDVWELARYGSAVTSGRLSTACGGRGGELHRRTVDLALREAAAAVDGFVLGKVDQARAMESPLRRLDLVDTAGTVGAQVGRQCGGCPFQRLLARHANHQTRQSGFPAFRSRCRRMAGCRHRRVGETGKRSHRDRGRRLNRRCPGNLGGDNGARRFRQGGAGRELRGGIARRAGAPRQTPGRQVQALGAREGLRSIRSAICRSR